MSTKTHDRVRRRMLQGAGALALIHARPLFAADGELPTIPAMTTFLAGRTPRRERIRLDLPRLADNGFAVPMRITVAGPFAPGPFVRTIAIFSEANPVPDLAVFEFPLPLERIELDSRIRLAGTQQVVAIAELTDGNLLATAMEVVVTLAGCMDGT
ncbi:MAG: thiosulfate oxidation carrier protein SoxY [Casimicrobiaceae bacterium]